jgi:hypothetical protein
MKDKMVVGMSRWSVLALRREKKLPEVEVWDGSPSVGRIKMKRADSPYFK